MRTYKGLFEKICSFENLYLAYLKARKCRRYRRYVLEFNYNLEENLLKLQRELLTHIYQHGLYREFIVCDSKKRKIKAAPFRDRVIHHAVCNLIEPIFNKGFIFDSFACRKEKGTHKAIKRLEKFIKLAKTNLKERDSLSRQIYCFQGDISKYFSSINHKILLYLIKKKIIDEKVLWLIKEISNSTYDKEPGVGIPIGNLTSQLFANIYLNKLDQFVKYRLRVKYYLRYMDDFLILDHHKKKLHQVKEEIREFLQDGLGLELHPKKANIFPIEGGIDFLGYQIFENYRLLRKSTVKRFIKRTKVYQKRLTKGKMTQEKFQNSLQSWLAYAKFANSWKLRKNLEEKLKVRLV